MLRIQSNLNEKQLRYEEIQFLAQRLFDNNRQLQMNQEEIVQLNSEIDTNTIYDMWQKDMIKDLKEKVDEREEHHPDVRGSASSSLPVRREIHSVDGSHEDVCQFAGEAEGPPVHIDAPMPEAGWSDDRPLCPKQRV